MSTCPDLALAITVVLPAGPTKAQRFLASHPELTACPLCDGSNIGIGRGDRDARCDCEGQPISWHGGAATERAMQVEIQVFRVRHQGRPAWQWIVRDQYSRPGVIVARGAGDYDIARGATSDADLARDAHLEALGVLEEDQG